MKKELRTAGKAIVITIVITLINLGLLVLAFCLPTQTMRQHLAESYPLIESESQYMQWAQGYTSSMMDFWSEYTLYGAAINEDAQGNAFERAMMMWYIDTPGLERDKAVEQYARYPEEHFELTAYPRYWNGAVIIMKFLLLVFTLPDIRMLNMFLNLTLLAVVIALMAKKNMVLELICFITTVFFINPITMIFSVMFSAEYIPMLVSIIAILLVGKWIDSKEGGWEIFFAITGCVVSFFSFLSSPFIALGIPLVFLLWVTNEKAAVKKVAFSSCYWAVSYGITWGVKWIVCTLFTSYNLLADVFNRVDIYENAENAENSGTTLIERFMHNFWVYKTPAFMILYVLAIIFIIVVIYSWRKSGRLRETVQKNAAATGNKADVVAGYVLVALIPFVITIALGNGYAYNHYFMAHRNFSITVLASLCIIWKLIVYLSDLRNHKYKH